MAGDTQGKEHLIPLRDGELEALIREGYHVTCAFDPGGVALKWVEGRKVPASVHRLGLMRGALNENMHGAGI